MATKPRLGLTIIELIVVIGIIGLLLSLLLPAIQRVRETANLMQCRANLRSITQAFALATAGNAPFPTGGCDLPGAQESWMFHFGRGAPRSPARLAKQNWGWSFQLLPYLGLEQQWAIPEVVIKVRHQMAAEIPVQAYQCPTRGRPRWLVNTPRGFPLAALDYAGNAGHLSFVDSVSGRPLLKQVEYPWPFISYHLPHSGIFGVSAVHAIPGHREVDPLLRPSRVDDGLSNTVLVAEKRINAALANSGTSGDNIQPGNSFGFCDGFSNDTVRSGAYPPARDEVDASRPTYDGFGSAHAVVFNVAFADGSVRAIAYGRTSKLATAADWSPWQRLCHRADGVHVSASHFE